MSATQVWLNGRRLPLEQAHISPLDRGLHYGDGLFETLRGQEGRPLHLTAHLARLATSCQSLNLELPEVAWEHVLVDLLAANRLTQGAARIKILLTRGQAQGLGLPPATSPTLLILAQPYEPPSEEHYRRGWRLACMEKGYSPPLAPYKSLNYLWYLWARQWALDRGADEAVILGPRCEVCETAAGSLLALDDLGWWTPQSPWRLRGVTLGLAREIMGAWGLSVADRKATMTELRQASTLWVLNSLMGVMPVAELDGLALPETAHELAAELRRKLLA